MNSNKAKAAKTKVASKKEATARLHSRITAHEHLSGEGNDVVVTNDVASVGRMKKLRINPVIRAIGLSLLDRRVVDVALHIANDSRALPNVAERLVGREKLVVTSLHQLASQGAVLAFGHLYEATTHKPRTWQLRILLSKSKQRGGSR